MSARIVTYEIRDKQGKLVKTLQAPSGSQTSDAIIQKYSQNPDFTYRLVAEPRSDDFKANEGSQFQSAVTKYNENITRIANEAQTRRNEELKRIESSKASYQSAVKEANTKANLFAKTHNNPFLTNPAVSSFYSKQANQARQKAINSEKENIDAINSYNDLTFQSVGFDQVPDRREVSEYVTRNPTLDELTKIKGGYINEIVGQKIPLNQDPNRSTTAENYSIGQSGVITSEKPRTLNKAESLEYNKQLITAQLPFIDSKNFYYDPVTKQTGSYKLDQQNRANDVILAQQAQTIQRVSFGKNGIDEIKNAVTQARQTGQASLTFTDKQGVLVTIPIQNSNQAIKTIYAETKNGSKDFKIIGTPQAQRTQEFQGPQQPKALDNPVGLLPSFENSLKYKNDLQRPSLNNSGIFIGSLASASETKSPSIPIFGIEAKQTIEPRPTVSDFIGNNPISKFIDDSFELDKPLTQRSDEPRRIGDISPKIFAGYSNREIGELVTPFSNKAIEAIDTFRATGEGLQGRESFEWKKDSFGIPHYDPIRKTPTPQNTVSKQLSEGKIPDFTDKNVRYGSYGNFFEIASEFVGLGKGVKIGLKTAEKLEDLSQKAKVTNIAKKTSEGKVYGIEKLGTDTFAIKRGTEGRGEIGISNKINPSLVVSKFKNRVEAFMSDTPKNVKIPKAQDPAKYDLGIVEFNKPDIVGKVKYTEYQKADNLTPEKQGTPFTVLGEVPRVTQADFGLIDKGNKIYSGLMSEKNINKLLEAERQGFINPVAIGKTAPAKAILKNDAELLREYALGSKQLRSKIYDTKPNEIGKQNEFIIGDYNTPLPRPIIKVGSEGLDRLLNRFAGKGTITGTAKAPKRAFRNLRPFDLNISEGKGVAGGSGKSASLTETEVNKIINVVKTGIKPISKANPEPIALPFTLGSFSSIVTYPQNTPQTITQTPASKFSDSITNTLSSHKIISGLETPQRSKRLQFTISPQRSNQSERLTPFVIPRGITRQTPSILPILTPIESTRQTPITPQRTDQPFKYDLITELITTPIFDTPRPTPREPPIPFTPLSLRGIGFPFAGFGGGIGEGRKPKKGKKKYLASSLDEFTPGVLEQAGVSSLRVGRTSKVYGIQERAIRKASKKYNTVKAFGKTKIKI